MFHLSVRIILSFLAAFLLSAGGIAAYADTPTALNREDIVALTKPAVVRIGQHVKGTATIPSFTIDLKERSVAVDTARPSRTVPVDETLSGSGFIVSSDGYIVTNSHVVSLSTTKIDVIGAAVLPTMFESALALSDEESKQVFGDEDATYEFSKKILEYAIDHSTFDVTQDTAVLNPSSQKEKFDELVVEGFSAQVVSVNDRFYADDKDVALIKIDQDNLPTIPMGSSQGLNVGKQISIFGFPATAEFNQRNPLESTFTQGVISALKDSEQKDFKVFQTDAKVSEGSSGGPLVDETGTVLGIITFQTDQFQKSTGDNFAFAIPIDMAQKMIADGGVSLKPSSYQARFTQGLGLLQNKHCLDASRVFDGIRSDNVGVFDVIRYIAPYSARCRLMIDSGTSIDTWQSRLEVMAGHIGASAWLAVGIAALFACSLGFVIWWLIREVNREEQEIQRLRQRLHKEEEQLSREHTRIEELSHRK